MTPRENDAKNFVEHLAALLADEDSRYIYADTVTNALVAAQIKALREERGLSQERLAHLMGTKQSGISRLQKNDYSAWKVGTLRKFARAFGVRLCISFEEFGTLIDDLGGLNEKRLSPRKFADDPVFNTRAESDLDDMAGLASGALERAMPSPVNPAPPLEERLGRRGSSNYPSAVERLTSAA